MDTGQLIVKLKEMPEYSHPRETLKYGNLFEVNATASLMAEYLTGSFSDTVILNTVVRSSDIIAGNSFAALSSFNQPLF